MVQSELKQLFGISNIGGMGFYLSLPESLGGAKSKIFNYVAERQQDRVNGWTSRLLSKRGDELLIKSVASAMPTFVMS